MPNLVICLTTLQFALFEPRNPPIIIVITRSGLVQHEDENAIFTTTHWRWNYGKWDRVICIENILEDSHQGIMPPSQRTGVGMIVNRIVLFT